MLKRLWTGEMWNATSESLSTAERTRCCHSTRQPIEVCECTISFGTPVVPEVWVM